MLYARESDGAVACDDHARFVPMTDDEEADWRDRIYAELGPDAHLCEFCADETGRESRFIFGEELLSSSCRLLSPHRHHRERPNRCGSGGGCGRWLL